MFGYVVRSSLLCFAAAAITVSTWIDFAAARDSTGNVILAYHRFGPVVSDSMTVTTAVFEQQLEWLAAHGYHVVPLRALVDGLRDPSRQLKPDAVAITADDGHQSVFTDMFPLI